MTDDKRKTYLYDPSGGKVTKRLFAVLVSLVGWILRPLLRDVDRGYAEEAFRREMRRHEPHPHGHEAPSDDPYCAEHGRRFDPAVGCPECVEQGEVT